MAKINLIESMTKYLCVLEGRYGNNYTTLVYWIEVMTKIYTRQNKLRVRLHVRSKQCISISIKLPALTQISEC